MEPNRTLVYDIKDTVHRRRTDNNEKIYITLIAIILNMFSDKITIFVTKIINAKVLYKIMPARYIFLNSDFLIHETIF